MTPTSRPGQPELVQLLALVYKSVDWKVQGGKNVLDRWSGMILVASRAETVSEMINTLCTRLGVGSIRAQSDVVVALLDACKPHDRELLELADREAVPLAMMAYDMARGK